MDIQFLEPDEFREECLARGIIGSPDIMVAKLEKALNVEEKYPATRPHKMHKISRKNPAREIKKCCIKLQEIKTNLDKIANISEPDIPISLKKSETRLIHIYGRLYRTTTSPKYREEAQKTLDICKKLLTSVQAALIDDTALDTLNQLRNIQIQEIETLSESEDDEAFVQAAECIEIHKIQRSDSHESLLSLSNIHLANPLNHPSDGNINQDCTGTSNRSHTPEIIRTFNSQQTSAANSLFNYPLAKPENSHSPKEDPISLVMEQLQKLSAQVQEISRNKDTSQEKPSDVAECTTQNPPANSVCKISAPMRVPPSERRSLARSGLTFDGSPTGIPVNRFLFRVDTLAASLNISDETLVTEISVILKGIAQDWYWTFRELNQSASWADLKLNFIARFQDRRTDYDIRRLVESRKQQSKETFIEFYNQIMNLTLQAPSLFSEAEIVHILRRNMRAGLQLALTDRDFSSISELVKSCTAWEDTWTRLRIDPDVTSVPKRVVNELNSQDNLIQAAVFDSVQANDNFPSIEAFQPSRPNFARQMDGSLGSQPMQKLSEPPNQNKIQFAICFNCKDIGHIFKTCPKPVSHVFCFKCGRDGIITPNCPCSGNLPRGSWRTGMPATPKSFQPSTNTSNPVPEHLRRTSQHLP